MIPVNGITINYESFLVVFIFFSLNLHNDNIQYKNSSGDEIANVNFCTTTTYM